MKMTFDAPINNKAKTNFDFFLLCGDFVGAYNHSSIVAIRTNNLTKFNQLRDVFIYDFVAATKVCEGRSMNYTLI